MFKTLTAKEKRYILLLVLFSFLLYLLWAIIIPYNRAPDEYQRFDIVRFIFKYRSLPLAGDKRLEYGPYGITYATTPYFPYIISALMSMALKAIGLNIPLYLSSRLLSVISGTGTVFFTFFICKKLFKESNLKYYVPCILATIPQFAFINSYTNQDSFTIFLTSIMIYLWFKGVEDNWDYKTVVLTGITSGIMLLSYLNGYTIILATLLIVLISYKDKLSKTFLYKLLLCIFVMFLVSAWFFIRNAVHYNGDFLGLRYMSELSETLAWDRFKPSLRATLARRNLGVWHLFFHTSWIKTTFKSFWAVFDYMTIHIKPSYYAFILILNIAGLAGVIGLIIKNVKNGVLKGIKDNKIYFTLIFSIIISTLLHIYYSVYSDYQPQGRYMFPALVPIVLLLFKGLYEVMAERYRDYAYKALTFIFISVNFYCLFKILMFMYYFV